MKTPKEVTIYYLESIKRDIENALYSLDTIEVGEVESVYKMKEEIQTLENAIKIVKESEGE